MVRRRDIRATSAIDIVDSAYRLDGTESEWLDALLSRARSDLDTGCGVYSFTGNENPPNFDTSPVFVQQELDAGFAERLQELNRDAPREIFDLLRTQLVSCGGLVQTLGVDSPVVRHFRAVLKPTGVTDGFSMFAQDGAGGSVTLSAPSRNVVSLAPRVRGIWRRVGFHIASSLRLRRRLSIEPDVRDALLHPSGKLEDAVVAIRDDKKAKSVLAGAVKAMEHARRADVRASPERALALWQGLVGGEWSLVDHWESGARRYIAAYRNRPELNDPRGFTPTERAILKYLALGATNKDIVYVLGLPTGTVSSAISQILKKLRMRRRVDLAVFADPSRMVRLDLAMGQDDEVGVLQVDTRPRGAAATSLSRAELEVAAYVIRGFANERIALERQVSTRTIANQLRSIFEKVGVTSRNQLASALTNDDATLIPRSR